MNAPPSIGVALAGDHVGGLIMSCGGFATLASVALLVVASCGTPTSTTHLWQAETVVRAPMNRVVVFGEGMSEKARRALEDHFVASLGERGVTAIPSYVFLPVLPEKDRARAAVQSGGFDGALVARLRGTNEREVAVTGSGYQSFAAGPGDDAQRFWDRYYGAGWGNGPGYTVEDASVSVETTVWDLREGGALVWSATTQTKNPLSTDDTMRSLAKEVVPKLAESGLIPPKP